MVVAIYQQHQRQPRPKDISKVQAFTFTATFHTNRQQRLILFVRNSNGWDGRCEMMCVVCWRRCLVGLVVGNLLDVSVPGTTEAHHYVVNACVHLSIVVVCLCFALEFMLLSADLQILISLSDRFSRRCTTAQRPEGGIVGQQCGVNTTSRVATKHTPLGQSRRHRRRCQR